MYNIRYTNIVSFWNAQAVQCLALLKYCIRGLLKGGEQDSNGHCNIFNLYSFKSVPGRKKKKEKKSTKVQSGDLSRSQK